MAHHEGAPGRPPAMVVGAVPPGARPVHLRPDRGQDHRQQRDRRDHADKRDHHPADADPPEKRHRQRDKRQQADPDRSPAEDHGVPGRLHRPLDGKLVGMPGRALLPPAIDHQQGVVDRDPEPDQRDQELHDRIDVGDRRDPADHEEGRQDRDRRDDQREHCQRRPEDVQQHRQCPNATDQGLDQHTSAALVDLRRQGGTPADEHRLPRHLGPRERALHLLDTGDPLAPGLEVDQPEGGAAIVGDKRLVTGGGPGDDPGLGPGLDDPVEDRGQLPPHAGRLDRRSLRQRHDRNERRRIGTVAVDLHDPGVGIGALSPRHVEGGRQPVHHDRHQGDTGDHRNKPEARHERLVSEDEPGDLANVHEQIPPHLWCHTVSGSTGRAAAPGNRGRPGSHQPVLGRNLRTP